MRPGSGRRSQRFRAIPRISMACSAKKPSSPRLARRISREAFVRRRRRHLDAIPHGVRRADPDRQGRAGRLRHHHRGIQQRRSCCDPARQRRGRDCHRRDTHIEEDAANCSRLAPITSSPPEKRTCRRESPRSPPGKGARIIFDPVAGPYVETLGSRGAPGGTIFVYGGLSMEPTPFPLMSALPKGLSSGDIR